MVKRLTERAFPVRARVTESSANTFTEVVINLPIAPVLGKGKLQAIEIMKVMSELTPPDSEDGQANLARAQVTKDSQSGVVNINNSQSLWARHIQVDNSAINGSYGIERTQYDDVTDGDGGGIIVAESVIHLGVVGTGNGAAGACSIVMFCHLVELDADDAITLLLEAD